MGSLHILLLLSMLIDSRFGCVGLIVVELVSCVLPVAQGPSRFWGVYCAIGLVAYDTGLSAVAVSMMLSFLGTQCYQVAQWHGGTLSFSDLLVFLMYGVTAIIVGYGFRWWTTMNTRQADEYLASEHELRRIYRLRDSDNAIRLHDSVAQCLAGIQLIAQRNIRDAHDGDAAEWRRVNDLAAKGQAEVRTIIDMMLEDEKEHDSAVRRSEWWLAVTAMADDGDAMLKRNGYRGKTELMDGGIGTRKVNEHDVRTLGAVLKELYSNIDRHAVPGSDYQASITLQKSATEIVMSNVIAASRNTSVRQGLKSRLYKLELIGGELDYEIDGDTWVVYARVPFADA
ncbi:histidine kinase [Bifidobacterium parmae]|uniref:Histidine kinase n=2 Tax=Bifidobacterium parmae TaxID=361854 RepID=A0A2N5J092_9BIFI|nr:histidine kinase [Bifidobacterium parmae]